jgi:hypothetical protein
MLRKHPLFYQRSLPAWAQLKSKFNTFKTDALKGTGIKNQRDNVSAKDGDGPTGYTKTLIELQETIDELDDLEIKKEEATRVEKRHLDELNDHYLNGSALSPESIDSLTTPTCLLPSKSARTSIIDYQVMMLI